MPQILPAIAFAAFNAGVPLAAVNALAGVGLAGAVTHGVIGIGLSVGASYAAGRLFAPQAIQPPSEGSFEFQQPIPIRFWPYGKVRISGPLGLLRTGEESAADGGHFDPNVTGTQLAKITIFSSRRLASIDEFYLNDEGPHELTAGYFLGYNQDGADHISALAYLGDPDQLADPSLLANFIGWTADHRLRGISYVLTCQGVKDPDDFTPVYGATGHKEANAVVSGTPVYDPRKDTTNGGSGSHRTNDEDTWEFSDNPTLCALDYHTHAEGRNKGYSRIDWASWVAAANIDDEDVPLKAGGTEKRYRLATIVRSDEPHREVMARILAARDGRLFRTADGKWGMRGGEWVEPTVTIDAADIIDMDVSPGLPVMQRVNQFELKCMLPEFKYGEAEIDDWNDVNDSEYLAGNILREQITLTQVPSASQARRLAKQQIARRNPKWIGELRTNLKGLNALGEDLITLTNAELDGADGFSGPFWINGPIMVDPTGCRIPVMAAKEDAYDWDPETEEGDTPGAPEPLLSDDEGAALYDDEGNALLSEAA